MAASGRAIRAPVDCVLFDLDDTLFDQREFLRGAFGLAAAAYDASVAERLHAGLLDDLRRHGTGGPAFERTLARLALPADDAALARMGAAFRAHAPARLPAAPGAADTLAALARRWPLGLVTDGEVVLQQAKLRALGIAPYFTVVVYSDALGGPATRKPDPAPFRAALHALGARAAHSVYVGDHPGRDVAGARALGLATVRVLTGEHRDRAAAPGEEADVTIPELAALPTVLPPDDARQA